MKRGLSKDADSERPSKKQNTGPDSDIFNDLSLQQSTDHIYERGTDGTGYLAGTVTMVWAAFEDRVMFRLKTCAEGMPYLVRISYPAEWDVSFYLGDEIKIALKGAQASKLTPPSHFPTKCNLKLVFTQGLLVQFVKRIKTRTHGEPDSIFSTYIPTNDDWFSTPLPAAQPPAQVDTVEIIEIDHITTSQTTSNRSTNHLGDTQENVCRDLPSSVNRRVSELSIPRRQKDVLENTKSGDTTPKINSQYPVIATVVANQELAPAHHALPLPKRNPTAGPINLDTSYHRLRPGVTDTLISSGTHLKRQDNIGSSVVVSSNPKRHALLAAIRPNIAARPTSADAHVPDRAPLPRVPPLPESDVASKAKDHRPNASVAVVISAPPAISVRSNLENRDDAIGRPPQSNTAGKQKQPASNLGVAGAISVPYVASGHDSKDAKSPEGSHDKGAKLSRRKQKKIAKEARKAEQKALELHQRQIPVQMEPIPVLQKPTATPVPSVEESHAISVPHNEPSEMQVAKIENTIGSRPALNISAGVVTSSWCYTPLNSLSLPDHCYNVIAVVLGSSAPKKSRRGDWFLELTIVDPSNHGVETTGGISVMCFTPRYRQWLPYVVIPGDIIIIRGIKASPQHNNAVGYKNRMQWVGFKPSEGRLYHGDLGDAPESDVVEDGDGAQPFSPFISHHGLVTEVQYSLDLADWWDAVIEARKELDKNTIVHQIGAPSGRNQNISRREHRLIANAGPTVAPLGYFDCTVEVLQLFSNDRTCSLYVTDYTLNPQITAVPHAWCSPELAKAVLQIELWDDATAFGEKMKPGEYWSLQNCRMQIARGGYLEAKICEPKMYKLDSENPDDAGNVHLAALLKRKSEWEDSAQGKGISQIHHHCVLADAPSNNHFFTATVEILHITHDPAFIYVTDYTARNDLSIPPDVPLPASLEGRVVKIQLMGGQEAMHKNVKPHEYYVIYNMRLRHDKISGTPGLYGWVGGSERLIEKRKGNQSKDENVQALCRRKKAWEKANAQNARRETVSVPSAQTASSKRSSALNIPSDCVSIQTMLDTKIVPSTFKVIARAVKLWPETLEECVIKRCRLCENDIPRDRYACTDCVEGDPSEVVHAFHMALEIEDQTGTRTVVHVDPRGKALAGLDAVDFTVDDDAFERFTERWRPLLKNLPEVQLSGSTEGIQTEMFLLTVSTWNAVPPVKGRDLQNFEALAI